MYVSPNDVNIYFEVHKLIYNDTQKGYSWRGICGQTDDRQPTQFKAVGRIFKSDGDIETYWILFNGKLVTAQHCLSAMYVDVIQFNVPNSYLNGVIRHPGPEDQYVVDNESIISGDDWVIFDVYANSVTGLTPKESQNDFYFVTNDIPDPQSNNVNITITGYGVAAGILNCTQQTASGLINYIEGNILYCQVDATEGTSGGPIVMVGTSNNTNSPMKFVIGIITEGYCGEAPDWGYNSGPSTLMNEFWNALNGLHIINVKIDQKLKDNQTSVGNVKRWEQIDFQNYGFKSYNVPREFNFIIGQSFIFRATEDIFYSQKFNKWNIGNIIKIHNEFTINNESKNIISKLDYTTNNITISNELIGATFYQKGDIEFKDPWLVNVTDSSFYEHPYGYRNLGMNAPFKQETSAFRPTLESKYKGMFLNQGGTPPNLTPPYYSVRVPLNQFIGTIYSEFAGWQATGAELADVPQYNEEGYVTKAVVFKQPNAVVKARYNPIYASVNTNLTSSWNLVSIPINIQPALASQIYPTATSPVYGFENSIYVAKNTVKPGEGYWVRFANSQTKNYTGAHILSASFPGKAGWNMIGTLSIPVSVSNISTYPENSIIGPFYSYKNGYVRVTTLEPGYGYWVKLAGDCLLLYNQGGGDVVPPEDPIHTDVLTRSDRFIIRDSEGNEQSLYVCIEDENNQVDVTYFELPPPVPEESFFDVRFVSDRFAEFIAHDADEVDLTISVQTENYPVTIEYELNPENNIEYTLGYSSGGYGKVNYQKLSGNENKIVINSKFGNRIYLRSERNDRKQGETPDKYLLSQNKPNPFNPVTTISYALPEPGFVTLKVYDVLGRELSTLVNEYREAGYYDISWDASSQPSGVYFYKLQSGNFTSVKKMLLMK
ncbi:MAG: Cell surface protein [Ignavibacteriae bacterium]|nr:MAG: Cell surface protein [Ignavibacteriota bacterium]